MKSRKPTRRSHPKERRTARPGTVLLLVVVVVGMLTLAAFIFAQKMNTEFEAASMYASDAQARASADSGVEFVATILGHKDTVPAETLLHNPQLFMGHVVSPNQRLRANSRFSVIAPVEHDTRNSAIRYGLMDESAKLNLNFLNNNGQSVDINTAMLMNIPNMTQNICHSILDWMDTDDTPNPYGAESDTYQGLQPPYKAKNGPFDSIDELLLVQGITPALLYGEDANRNGLLDPNENDGDASPPFDNADGVLNHGFIAYFSVHGRESNRQVGGNLKINVNNGYLTDLYDALIEAFDEDTAKFIIGYRINGPTSQPPVSQTNPVVAPDPSTASGDAATATDPQSIIQEEAATGLTNFMTYVTSNGGSVTKGGIDLSKGGKTTIASLWQLVGATTTATIGGTRTTLNSPWSSDTGSITTSIPDMMSKLTVTTDEYLEGRVNINQARREILIGLPTMTEEIVNGILDSQHLDSNGQPSADTLHATTAWLYADGLVDLAGMINLDPYITGHGDVYRVQVLGFFDGGGPVSRIEATVDSTKLPPRIISQRDMNELGRGYSRMQMLPMLPSK